MLKLMKKKKIPASGIFIFWVMVKILRIVWKWRFFLSQKMRNVSPTKKNCLFKSGQILRKDVQCSEMDFLVHEFFCATFSFWDMVDFVCGQFWCIWLTLCIKIDLISKTERRTRKNSWTINLFQSNAHLSCKFGHFWTHFYFFGWWHTWKFRWHTSKL